MSVIRPATLLQELIKVRATNKERKGVTTGFDSIDEYMLLCKQYLLLLTGFPNYGKSEFLDALAVNSAYLHGWNWLYFSTENDNYTTHLRKLASKFIGKPLMNMTLAELTAAVAWCDNHFSWVNPGEVFMTLDNVLELAATRIESGEQIDVVVVDPWNELNHLSQTKRDDQYISDAMMKCRRFYTKYNVLMVIVIHPRSVEKNKDGAYPIPHLRDCAGGAMWWNKAGYGICVHRKDFSVHGAHIYIQKVKDKTIGMQGAAWLDYDPSSGLFKDTHARLFGLPSIVTTLEAPFK